MEFEDWVKTLSPEAQSAIRQDPAVREKWHLQWSLLKSVVEQHEANPPTYPDPMEPPWIMHPSEDRADMFWRMGGGQDDMIAFHRWFSALSKQEQFSYIIANPEPDNWVLSSEGFYETIQGLSCTREEQQEVIAEIIRLHDFICAWLQGDAWSDEFNAHLADALHTEFMKVQATGAELQKAALLGPIHDAYGVYPDLQITIEQPRTIATWPNKVLATYIERQSKPNRSTADTGHRSVVVFQRTDRLLWHRIHETGI